MVRITDVSVQKVDDQTPQAALMGKKFTSAQTKGDGDDPKQSRTVTTGGNI